jgi:hypothetical protein
MQAVGQQLAACAPSCSISNESKPKPKCVCKTPTDARKTLQLHFLQTNDSLQEISIVIHSNLRRETSYPGSQKNTLCNTRQNFALNMKHNCSSFSSSSKDIVRQWCCTCRDMEFQVARNAKPWVSVQDYWHCGHRALEATKLYIQPIVTSRKCWENLEKITLDNSSN